MRFSLLTLLFAVSGAAADTTIHRCLLDDGTFAFQETPCVQPDDGSDDDETPAADEETDEFVNPFDEPAEVAARTEPAVPERLSKDRAACEKETRDAIDAIDMELQEQTRSTAQRERYLADLLALTRRLRACKQL